MKLSFCKVIIFVSIGLFSTMKQVEGSDYNIINMHKKTEYCQNTEIWSDRISSNYYCYDRKTPEACKYVCMQEELCNYPSSIRCFNGNNAILQENIAGTQIMKHINHTCKDILKKKHEIPRHLLNGLYGDMMKLKVPFESNSKFCQESTEWIKEINEIYHNITDCIKKIFITEKLELNDNLFNIEKCQNQETSDYQEIVNVTFEKEIMCYELWYKTNLSYHKLCVDYKCCFNTEIIINFSFLFIISLCAAVMCMICTSSTEKETEPEPVENSYLALSASEIVTGKEIVIEKPVLVDKKAIVGIPIVSKNSGARLV